MHMNDVSAEQVPHNTRLSYCFLGKEIYICILGTSGNGPGTCFDVGLWWLHCPTLQLVRNSLSKQHRALESMHPWRTVALLQSVPEGKDWKAIFLDPLLHIDSGNERVLASNHEATQAASGIALLQASCSVLHLLSQRKPIPSSFIFFLDRLPNNLVLCTVVDDFKDRSLRNLPCHGQ
ncbi:hypothetical protein EJ08DRAFT_426233 [Tothia fuscella]|uniref:Uncharacterized protein n=1 Tax=Tothia fuscella TaxID=1048955 RepID=A0A9P4U2L8_9PEZI|nr:hypothetical protein EJ08DRAFT_426233 [Tothia fuscella]